MPYQERRENQQTIGHFGIPKETWVVFSIRTVNSLGFSATLPFLGVYLLDVRSVPLSEIGVVYLATGILGIGSRVLSGWMSDSLGPKKVMLLGQGSSLLSSLLLGYLVLINASVYSFFILYPLFSLLRGVSQPATASIIAAQRSTLIRTGFSFLNIGGNLGFAIGPAISGIIIDVAGYSTAFLLSASAAGVAGIIAWIWIDGNKYVRTGKVVRVKSRLLTWKEDKNIVLFLIVSLCMFVSIGYEITPLSLYVASVFGFSNTLIGYLFATNGLVIVVLQLPITRLMERSRTLLLPLVVSAGIAALSFMIAGFSRTFVEWEIFMFVITLAEITLTVPSQSIIALFSETGNRGTYQGYYSAISNAGRSLASFIGPTSFALFAFYPALSWFIVSAFSFATTIAVVCLSPRIQRDYETKILNSEDKNS